MNKRYNFDKESDTLFICLKDKEVEDRFEEIVPGINVEYNKKNEIIGIEILKVSRFSKKSLKSKSTARSI